MNYLKHIWMISQSLKSQKPEGKGNYFETNQMQNLQASNEMEMVYDFEIQGHKWVLVREVGINRKTSNNGGLNGS